MKTNEMEVERKNLKWYGDVFVISPQGKDTRTHNHIYISAKLWLKSGQVEASRGEGYAYRRIDEEAKQYTSLLPAPEL